VSWGRDLGLYAMKRERNEWRHVSLPDELNVPRWLKTDREPWDDRVQWAPAGDRIAFIPSNIADYWFAPGGKVMVADADGSNEHLVAEDAEVPRWSPDGKRLSFARCEIDEGKSYDERSAKCALWIVPADGTSSEKLLVDDADSPPVWSPDGRFVAFLRHADPCPAYCRARIVVVGVEDHEPRAVGPDLVELAEYYPAPWPGLAWLPDAEPIAVTEDEARGDQLERQRCVDIWNRARMRPWPTGAVSVSIVSDRCQVTVSDYGAVCTQAAEMPFRFWCPSHGAGVHRLPPEDLVWNAHGEEDGKLSLFDEPKGSRLPLPKAPSHPMLDGWVMPYGKDRRPLPDLKLTKVAGTCEGGTGMPGHPFAYPDRYGVQCYWRDGEGRESCFTPEASVAAGDTVFCPTALWEEPYDPLSFFAVKVTDVY
jgi:hypothetical protein